MIAGLESITGGAIKIGGRVVNNLAPKDRDIAMVFQNYALYPHKTVAENMSFALKLRKTAKSEMDSRVRRAAEILDIVPYLSRFPRQLSGGQRQRVALARALAVSPHILLLDEPFGALDATVRKTLRRELRRLHEATGLTTVFVTHDQEEALDLADRIAILNGGQIEQVGAPMTVLDQPASAFVAGFVGQSNALAGQVRGGMFTYLGAVFPAAGVPDGAATAFVRPDQFELAADHLSGIAVRLDRILPRGPLLWLNVTTSDGQDLEAAIVREALPAVRAGDTVALSILGAQVFPI
jgi:sulfate transport system ATP-binding protein